MTRLRRRKLVGYFSTFKIIVYCTCCVFVIGFVQVFSFVERGGVEDRNIDSLLPFTQNGTQHSVLHDNSTGVHIRTAGNHGSAYNRTHVYDKGKRQAVGSAQNNSKHDFNKTEQECTDSFEDTFIGNLRVISQYPRDDVNTILDEIKGNRKTPSMMMTSFPVIATAANAGFYEISQGLLKSLHTVLLPKYTDLKIVYYDLGLRQEQVEELKMFCKCEVRKFPFEDYPPHVKNLKTYAWKPIIVQGLLMEYGWVWWMDSSVRFITDQLNTAIQYSRDNHFLFFTYGPILSVAYQTDVQTMQYLKEDPCKFRPFGEIEATFVLFHFDNVTSTLVEAWCACALTQNCIAPPRSGSKLGCNVRIQQDGRCHRFDQAVLSILFRRLYHAQNDYPLVEMPFKIHVIRRGNRVSYFNELNSVS